MAHLSGRPVHGVNRSGNLQPTATDFAVARCFAAFNPIRYWSSARNKRAASLFALSPSGRPQQRLRAI